MIFVTSVAAAETQLLMEALAMAASRHEAMARVQKFGRPHDDKAKAMRALRASLLQRSLAVTLPHGPACACCKQQPRPDCANPACAFREPLITNERPEGQ